MSWQLVIPQLRAPNSQTARLTLLLARYDLHVGVGEQEVKMHRDVSPQILQQCFLLTENITQPQQYSPGYQNQQEQIKISHTCNHCI